MFLEWVGGVVVVVVGGGPDTEMDFPDAPLSLLNTPPPKSAGLESVGSSSEARYIQALVGPRGAGS